MAKTRSVQVYRAPAYRPPSPVIRIAAPRAPSSPKKRRSGGGRRGQGSTKDILMKVALGGAAFGLLEKLGPTIPTIPVLGRAGTVAVAAYFFGGQKPGLARDICIASTVLASYQLVKDGKVSGDDE